MKVSELTGKALDYAVALCEGGVDFRFDTVATYWITINGKDLALSPSWAQSFTPSTDWRQGGPILEREKISIQPRFLGLTEESKSPVYQGWQASELREAYWMSPRNVLGETPLIAAMRCYVESKLGNEIEIPKELL